MRLLDNDAVALTPREFRDLPNYSFTLPTGTTPGKAWRAQRGGEWWRAVYGKPYPDGHEHFGSIPIGWRRIVRVGIAPTFPRISVARPAMRGLPADAVPGDDDGDLCLRIDGAGMTCLGLLEYTPAGRCSCSTSPMPPCGACENTMPECPACGWRAEE